MTKAITALTLAALLVAGFAAARYTRRQARRADAGAATTSGSPDMPGMDMESDADASQAMATDHLDMGSHMKMTAPRPAAPGDAARAAAIVASLRVTLEKYRDYRVALADGYQIFFPGVPQPQYHFTNYARGFEAAWTFDPAKPTSLLYKKTADGYELLGAMYTAPRWMSEDKLNARVPLSIASWHAHVNICLPPASATSGDRAKFGFAGSITTAEACRSAGGRFKPQIFGWMVHVYPFAVSPEDVWRH